MQVQQNGQTAHVTGAIKQAAKTTGANFDYLLTTAQIESNLNPNAQAATSSAHGLFQFIDQTWFATMKQAGPALGYAGYANAIVQGPDGRFDVADPATRSAIMKLRADPKVAAMMAGAFTRSNAAQLAGDLGRSPSEGELYIAHFLGPDGASRLISAAVSRPDARAADVFPTASSANRSIFYDRSGNARSVIGVYRTLTDRYEMARAGTSDIGLRGSLPPEVAAAGAPNPIPDTAGMTQVFVDANVAKPRPIPEDKPLFQAMFNSRGDEPVAPVVRDLWTQARPPAAIQAGSFNLFSDAPQAPPPARNGR